MLRAAARLARAGSAAVSAAAGLLMLVLLAFGGFAQYPAWTGKVSFYAHKHNHRR